MWPGVGWITKFLIHRDDIYERTGLKIAGVLPLLVIFCNVVPPGRCWIPYLPFWYFYFIGNVISWMTNLFYLHHQCNTFSLPKILLILLIEKPFEDHFRKKYRITLKYSSKGSSLNEMRNIFNTWIFPEREMKRSVIHKMTLPIKWYTNPYRTCDGALLWPCEGVLFHISIYILHVTRRRVVKAIALRLNRLEDVHQIELGRRLDASTPLIRVTVHLQRGPFRR